MHRLDEMTHLDFPSQDEEKLAAILVSSEFK